MLWEGRSEAEGFRNISARERNTGCDSAFQNHLCIKSLHSNPVQPEGKTRVLRFGYSETIGLEAVAKATRAAGYVVRIIARDATGNGGTAYGGKVVTNRRVDGRGWCGNLWPPMAT